MLLTIDVGNTQNVLGLYDSDSDRGEGAGVGLVDHWRLSTDADRTADEYSVVIRALLDSAVANARQKDENLDVDALYVRIATVDKAPDRNFRRWRPRAMGRATRIVKGVSHIAIELDTRD